MQSLPYINDLRASGYDLTELDADEYVYPPTNGAPMQTDTDVPQFIADLDGGVFEQKLADVLSKVAAGVVDNKHTGSVTVKFALKRIGESHQVEVTHKLSYTKPTAKGDITENNTTSTPMHVGVGGRMTLFPETQVPQGQQHLFNGRGEKMEGAK